MTTNKKIRRQLILQNNFLETLAVVPNHGISQKGMKDKVEDKLNKIPGIQSIEGTPLIEIMGNGNYKDKQRTC